MEDTDMAIKATFVGTGIIGAGLAANAALAGFDVTLYDVVPVEKIKENFKKVLDILVEAGATDQAAADKAMADAKYSTELKEAVEGAEFVQEAIPERLQLKIDTYRQIQEVTGPNTIIASTTSAMFPSKLREGALYPDSIIVGHPYNPSYLLPLIEVCGGNEPCMPIIEKAMAIYKAMKKEPILCRKEIIGFVVNRMSWAALAAAKESVREGVCSVEDMDKAIMYGPGMRMAVLGQLLTISLGIPGGFREEARKYGNEPTPYDGMYADGVDEEIANRPQWQGNTVEEVAKWRDKQFVEILKLHHML